MFKRNPSLTEQTRQYIRDLILKNEFGDGRIPSETELAAALKVSRTTVRDALSKLENEGAIIRKQGVGTFVNPSGLQVKARLEEIWSYEEVLRAHGYTPVVKVLQITTQQADAATVQRLGLTAGEEVLFIEKLFLEESTPVILTQNIVPSTLVQCTYDVAQARRPIYEFLEDCCKHILSYYLSDIVPVVADAPLAERLGIEAGQAVLGFDEVGYDAEGHPLLWARSWFRDDRLRFRLIRRHT